MKLEHLKMAMDALNDHYDLTLNTDNSYESVRSREAILKRHYSNLPPYVHERRIIHEVIDAYLAMRAFVDECEKSPLLMCHMAIDKAPPMRFTEGL